MMNCERNAEIRKMIAEGTRIQTINHAANMAPKFQREYPNGIRFQEEGTTIDGICIECGNGKHRFVLAHSVVDKYAGTLRETMTQSPCPCGSYMWLNTPKNNRIDDMLE